MSGEQRREQVLAIVKENPDIKAREIAAKTGTTPTNVYNALRKLKAEGALRRMDGRLLAT